MQYSWFSVTKRQLFAFAIVTKLTKENNPEKSWVWQNACNSYYFLGREESSEEKKFFKTLRKSSVFLLKIESFFFIDAGDAFFCELWSEDHIFPNWTVGHHRTMIDKTGSVQIFHPLWRLQWDWCCVASSVEENSAQSPNHPHSLLTPTSLPPRSLFTLS